MRARRVLLLFLGRPDAFQERATAARSLYGVGAPLTGHPAAIFASPLRNDSSRRAPVARQSFPVCRPSGVRSCQSAALPHFFFGTVLYLVLGRVFLFSFKA